MQVLASCIRTWKLRDRVTASQFQLAFKLKVTAALATATTATHVTADTANHVETVWTQLMHPLLDAATKVCSLSNDHQWRPKTWCWNEQVDKAIQEKHARFKACKILKKGDKMAEAKEAETAHNATKCVAKYAVWIMFSLLPNRWTTQTMILLAWTLYATMLVNLRLLMMRRLRYG